MMSSDEGRSAVDGLFTAPESSGSRFLGGGPSPMLEATAD